MARGSTLIEILVSIVVLALGLLGMVGLQAASLQNNREARLQSTAVRMAGELAERMRGNHGVAVLDGAANPYLQADVTERPAIADVDCLVASCATPLAVARWDVNEWLRRVFSPDGGLPGARVVVCFDEMPYASDGLPRWECSGTGAIVHVKLGWSRAATDRSLGGAAAVERVLDTASRPAVTMPIVAGMPS